MFTLEEISTFNYGQLRMQDACRATDDGLDHFLSILEELKDQPIDFQNQCFPIILNKINEVEAAFHANQFEDEYAADPYVLAAPDAKAHYISKSQISAFPNIKDRLPLWARKAKDSPITRHKERLGAISEWLESLMSIPTTASVVFASLAPTITIPAPHHP